MTAILGVLNITPDSFSDGGRWQRLDAAVQHARELRAAGADWIDVGGESTRPGAEAVDSAEEQARVLPVVRALAEHGIPVSIDTRNAATARAAVAVGAGLVNDVSGGLSDPRMADFVAEAGVLFVAMHWRGGADGQPTTGDVLAEVREALAERFTALETAGIRRDRIILDPGLGFAKTAQQNWELLGGLAELTALAPVLVGASRKRFLGELLPEGAPLSDRDAPTATISALAARAGAWGVRVHDVRASRLALDVEELWRSGGRSDRA